MKRSNTCAGEGGGYFLPGSNCSGDVLPAGGAEVASAKKTLFESSQLPLRWVLILIGRAMTAPMRSSTMENRGEQKHLRSLTEVVVDFVWCKTCGTKYEGELSDCLRLGHELTERQVKTLKLV
jgi:hypothetical protein